MIRAFLALAMLTTFSVAAGVIENGVRGLALAEAQMAADAGALAGAGWLKINPTGELAAQASAARFANFNRVRHRTVQVTPADVVVNLDSGTVRVEVHARASGIPRALAWILGVNEVSVSALATAEVRSCPGPVMGRIQQWCQRLKLIE